MNLDSSLNYDDLRRRAKRYVPRIAFDFLEGGVDDELGIARNSNAFSHVALLPQYLGDPGTPALETTLFGQTFSAPVGIAPTGGACLFRQDADLSLARAARDANIPFIISGASTATMEDIAAVARDTSWYQLYLAKDRAISDDMVARADRCGFSTLVLSVDVPSRVRRERDLRNGFARPMRPTPAVVLEALTHPAWLWSYFTGQKLTMSNWVKYGPAGATPDQLMQWCAQHFPTPSTWDDVKRIRKLWPRNFVIKGLMHPDDCRRASELGVDGVIISNHGGRQLDRSPAPVEVLPLIRDLVGDRVTLMLDSGIRRGSDIAVSLALGAKFCFVGRWTLYGVAAAGEPGARHAIKQIRTELTAVMRQLGAMRPDELGPRFLMPDARSPFDHNLGTI